MDVAREMKAARKRSGLTQGQLAERAGTSQATVSAYESGRKQPSAETFSRLLLAAGTRLQVSAEVGPAVRFPGRAERERRGAILKQVIELAEALPSRPAPQLRYPRIADLRASMAEA